MTQSDARNSASEARARIIGILLMLIFASGGGTAVWKYLRHNISHDMLASYHGVWLLSECDPMNLLEEGWERELVCIGSFTDSSSMDFIKICNVSFHCWLCHRINDTATFSCDTKPVEPRPTEERQRQLNPDEVESLRKRNECEQRFYDNKIYEIHGMSVMAACKQNPERRPRLRHGR